MLSGKYWISFYPGIALLVTIVSINLVGDQLRDVLNPRLKTMSRGDTLRACDARSPAPHFFTRAGVVKAVDDVSFTVERGKVLGLVGESRLGQVGHRLLHHRPGRSARPHRRRADPVPGHATWRPRTRAMRDLRGNRIAMIFQDPMMTLNPVLRIDTQMIETVQAHATVSRGGAAALRATRSARSASRRRTNGCAPIRTNSPAACASASPSPSPCCTRPT